MNLATKLASIVAVALLSGCSPSIARDMFSLQTGCPKNQTQRRKLADRTEEVTGCGQTRSYRCTTKHFPYKQILCAELEPPQEDVAYLSPEPAMPPAPAVTMSRMPDGSQLIRVSFRVSETVAMHVSGRPSLHPDAAVIDLQLLGPSEQRNDCDLRMVINGQAVAMPAPTYKTSGGHMSTVRVGLGLDQIQAMAEARRVAGRVCDRRWQLTKRELTALHAFVHRFREELALEGKPQEDAPRAPAGSTISL